MQFPSVMNMRLPSDTEYAAIPSADSIRDLFERRVDVTEAAKSLMVDHGVQEQFVLFALHKHFDVPEANVLLLQQITINEGAPAEVVHPVPVTALHNHKGSPVPVAFMVSDDGHLQPYKYSYDVVGPDFLAVEAFLVAFVQLLTTLGAEREFALKLPNVSAQKLDMNEGEIPEFGATVLVPSDRMPDHQPQDEFPAATSFGECAANESHLTSVNNPNHTVYVGSGKDKDIYEAATKAIHTFSMNAQNATAVA